MSAIKQLVLERVQFATYQKVSDLVVQDASFAVEHDVMCRERIITAICDQFGIVEVKSLTAPTSWWQHLKQSVRDRWPRLFRWLRVRTITVTIDGGAILAGLRREAGPRDHRVLPVRGNAKSYEQQS